MSPRAGRQQGGRTHATRLSATTQEEASRELATGDPAGQGVEGDAQLTSHAGRTLTMALVPTGSHASPMDTTRDPLVPSPTTSMSRSPPSADTTVSPAHTPPKSPATSGSLKSNSPSSIAGDSPLPPLPAEVFLLILQYLPSDHTRRRLLFVSRSWKSFLVSEPSLWPYFEAHLEHDTGDYDALWTGRGSVNAPKPGGGIRVLGIILRGQPNSRGNRHGDLVNTPTMIHRFNRLNYAIHSACIATVLDEQGRRVQVRPSTLRCLNVVLEPNTAVSLAFLHELSHATQYDIYQSLERSVFPWM